MKGKTRTWWRSFVLGATGAGFCLFLAGCTVHVARYTSRGVVEAESAPRTIATAEVMPWKVGADFLLNLFSLGGKTRQMAIQKGRGYTEERSLSLISVEKEGVSESKVEKEGDNYKSERKEELR